MAHYNEKLFTILLLIAHYKWLLLVVTNHPTIPKITIFIGGMVTIPIFGLSMALLYPHYYQFVLQGLMMEWLTIYGYYEYDCLVLPVVNLLNELKPEGAGLGFYDNNPSNLGNGAASPWSYIHLVHWNCILEC